MPHVEHVLPMIPGGASFKDIITGEEVLRRWLVFSAPRNQGCEMHVRRTQLWALVYLHPLDLLTTVVCCPACRGRRHPQVLDCVGFRAVRAPFVAVVPSVSRLPCSRFQKFDRFD